MHVVYQRKAFLPLLVGVLGSVISRVGIPADNFQVQHSLLFPLGQILDACFLVIFVLGCTLYCRAKGQSPWYSAFGLTGLCILLYCLDKTHWGLMRILWAPATASFLMLLLLPDRRHARRRRSLFPAPVVIVPVAPRPASPGLPAFSAHYTRHAKEPPADRSPI